MEIRASETMNLGSFEVSFTKKYCNNGIFWTLATLPIAEMFEAKMRAPLGRAFTLKEMRCTTSWPTQSSGRKPHFASLARQCSEKQEVSRGEVHGLWVHWEDFCCFTAELFVIFPYFSFNMKSWSEVYMITGPPGVGKSEFTIWIAGRCLRSVQVFSHLCEHLPCVSTRSETLFRSL